MTENSMPICVAGLEEIAPLYDAFLIDQWGVIHDGNSLYNGALEALEELTKAKKTIIILTNSSKTNKVNAERLENKFGISPQIYTKIISSAELLKDFVTERPSAPWNTFGKKIFLIADGTDDVLIKESDLEIVSSVKESDLIMLLSIGENQNHLNQSWIKDAIVKDLTLVCPSADQLTVNPNGVFQGMGAIVGEYIRNGGNVINVGKPEALIYDYAHQFVAGIPQNRILAIGDQIASDVFGAKRYGYHAALVATGAAIKSFPLSNCLEDLARDAFSASNPKSLSPNWILPSLQW